MITKTGFGISSLLLLILIVINMMMIFTTTAPGVVKAQTTTTNTTATTIDPSITTSTSTLDPSSSSSTTTTTTTSTSTDISSTSTETTTSTTSTETPTPPPATTVSQEPAPRLELTFSHGEPAKRQFPKTGVLGDFMIISPISSGAGVTSSITSVFPNPAPGCTASIVAGDVALLNNEVIKEWLGRSLTLVANSTALQIALPTASEQVMKALFGDDTFDILLTDAWAPSSQSFSVLVNVASCILPKYTSSIGSVVLNFEFTLTAPNREILAGALESSLVVYVAKLVTLGTGIFITSATTASHGIRSGFTMSMMECLPGGHPPFRLESPLGGSVTMGEGWVAPFTGAALMNIFMLILFGVFGILASLAWAKLLRKRDLVPDGFAAMRFPGILHFPVLFWILPTTKFATVSIVNGTTSQMAGGALVFVIIALIVVLVVLRVRTIWMRFMPRKLDYEPEQIRKAMEAKYKEIMAKRRERMKMDQSLAIGANDGGNNNNNNNNNNEEMKTLKPTQGEGDDNKNRKNGAGGGAVTNNNKDKSKDAAEEQKQKKPSAIGIAFDKAFDYFFGTTHHWVDLATAERYKMKRRQLEEKKKARAKRRVEQSRNQQQGGASSSFLSPEEEEQEALLISTLQNEKIGSDDDENDEFYFAAQQQQGNGEQGRGNGNNVGDFAALDKPLLDGNEDDEEFDRQQQEMLSVPPAKPLQKKKKEKKDKKNNNNNKNNNKKSSAKNNNSKNKSSPSLFVESTDPNPIRRAVLNYHNKLRAEHGVSPLEWHEDCETFSQKCADNCTATKKMVHGNDHGDLGSHGQNIFFKSARKTIINGKMREEGTDWNEAEKIKLAEEAVQSWYDERHDPGYDFTKDGMTQKGTGHFTQVVWSSSKYCGLSFSPCGKFIVANYFPAGNIAGQFQECVHETQKAVNDDEDNNDINNDDDDGADSDLDILDNNNNNNQSATSAVDIPSGDDDDDDDDHQKSSGLSKDGATSFLNLETRGAPIGTKFPAEGKLFRRRYGLMFKEYHSKCYWFYLVELLFCIACGIFEGIRLGTNSCVAGALLFLISSFAYLGLMYIRAPVFNLRIDRQYTVAICITHSVAALFYVMAKFAGDDSTALTVALFAIVVTCCIVIFKASVHFLFWFWKDIYEKYIVPKLKKMAEDKKREEEERKREEEERKKRELEEKLQKQRESFDTQIMKRLTDLQNKEQQDFDALLKKFEAEKERLEAPKNPEEEEEEQKDDDETIEVDHQQQEEAKDDAVEQENDIKNQAAAAAVDTSEETMEQQETHMEEPQATEIHKQDDDEQEQLDSDLENNDNNKKKVIGTSAEADEDIELPSDEQHQQSSSHHQNNNKQQQLLPRSIEDEMKDFDPEEYPEELELPSAHQQANQEVHHHHHHTDSNNTHQQQATSSSSSPSYHRPDISGKNNLIGGIDSVDDLMAHSPAGENAQKAADKVYSQQEADYIPVRKFCTSCGSGYILGKERFCIECGEKLPMNMQEVKEKKERELAEAQQQQNQQKKTARKKTGVENPSSLRYQDENSDDDDNEGIYLSNGSTNNNGKKKKRQQERQSEQEQTEQMWEQAAAAEKLAEAEEGLIVEEDSGSDVSEIRVRNLNLQPKPHSYKTLRAIDDDYDDDDPNDEKGFKALAAEASDYDESGRRRRRRSKNNNNNNSSSSPKNDNDNDDDELLDIDEDDLCEDEEVDLLIERLDEEDERDEGDLEGEEEAYEEIGRYGRNSSEKEKRRREQESERRRRQQLLNEQAPSLNNGRYDRLSKLPHEREQAGLSASSPYSGVYRPVTDRDMQNLELPLPNKKPSYIKARMNQQELARQQKITGGSADSPGSSSSSPQLLSPEELSELRRSENDDSDNHLSQSPSRKYGPLAGASVRPMNMDEQMEKIMERHHQMRIKDADIPAFREFDGDDSNDRREMEELDYDGSAPRIRRDPKAGLRSSPYSSARRGGAGASPAASSPNNNNNNSRNFYYDEDGNLKQFDQPKVIRGGTVDNTSDKRKLREAATANFREEDRDDNFDTFDYDHIQQEQDEKDELERQLLEEIEEEEKKQRKQQRNKNKSSSSPSSPEKHQEQENRLLTLEELALLGVLDPEAPKASANVDRVRNQGRYKTRDDQLAGATARERKELQNYPDLGVQPWHLKDQSENEPTEEEKREYLRERKKQAMMAGLPTKGMKIDDSIKIYDDIDDDDDEDLPPPPIGGYRNSASPRADQQSQYYSPPLLASSSSSNTNNYYNNYANDGNDDTNNSGMLARAALTTSASSFSPPAAAQQNRNNNTNNNSGMFSAPSSDLQSTPAWLNQSKNQKEKSQKELKREENERMKAANTFFSSLNRDQGNEQKQMEAYRNSAEAMALGGANAHLTGNTPSGSSSPHRFADDKSFLANLILDAPNKAEAEERAKQFL